MGGLKNGEECRIVISRFEFANLLSYYILVDIFFPVILTTIPLFIAWNDFYEILILLLLQLMRISGFAAIIFTLRDDEN